MKLYAQMKFDNLLNLLQGVSTYQNNTSVRSGNVQFPLEVSSKQNKTTHAQQCPSLFPNKYCLLCLFLVCLGYFSLVNLKYTSSYAFTASWASIAVHLKSGNKVAE